MSDCTELMNVPQPPPDGDPMRGPVADAMRAHWGERPEYDPASPAWQAWADFDAMCGLAGPSRVVVAEAIREVATVDLARLSELLEIATMGTGYHGPLPVVITPSQPGEPFTAGPWHSDRGSFVYSPNPVRGIGGGDEVGYYGGYLVCESVNAANRRLIEQAPALYELVRWMALNLKDEGLSEVDRDAARDRAMDVLDAAVGVSVWKELTYEK